jgi:hypothetical protein
MEQEKETKKKRKGKMLQKSELEETWRRYATLFQVNCSNVEKREEVGIREDAPGGYCGLA